MSERCLSCGADISRPRYFCDSCLAEHFNSGHDELMQVPHLCEGAHFMKLDHSIGFYFCANCDYFEEEEVESD